MLILKFVQVARFTKQGIRAVAINAVTLRKARAEGRDLWQEARSGKYQIVLTSPEQLQTRSFDRMIEDKLFREKLARFVTDEAHVVLQWSNSLRPAYGLLADMRERLPEHVVYMAMTATLPPGPPTTTVLRSLGYQHGRYVVERQDCERTDMTLIIRELQHGIDRATAFPDLDWLV
ncbi:hypothetical protein EXIGLDRAFT_594884, partial [Exidia glandulosa HHB12029]